MRDHPVDRANPNRERRPVLCRTATAARRFVLSRRGGNQSETIRFEFVLEDVHYWSLSVTQFALSSFQIERDGSRSSRIKRSVLNRQFSEGKLKIPRKERERFYCENRNARCDSPGVSCLKSKKRRPLSKRSKRLVASHGMDSFPSSLHPSLPAGR